MKTIALDALNIAITTFAITSTAYVSVLISQKIYGPIKVRVTK